MSDTRGSELQIQSIILCEGYYDRAFWAGWLIDMGFMDPGLQPGKAARIPIRDPWGRAVGRGQFAFRSPGDGFVRVVPCGGRANVIPRAREFIKEQATRELAHMVLNVDDDANAGEIPSDTALTPGDLLGAIQNVAPDATYDPAQRRITSGLTVIHLVAWRTDDPPNDLLPTKQCLERLVCGALAEVYPDRATAVARWLKDRPDPPDSDPKEFAWSHMAGWYAKHGCEDFLRHLWREPAVADALRTRLTQCKADTAMKALLGTW